MKRFKSKTNRAIAKTLAGSVLLGSCSPVPSFSDLYEDPSGSENTKESSKGVPLSLSLTEETKELAKNINLLANEIISDPVAAKELAADPEAFALRRGYSFTIDLDDPMIKLVIALGDEELNCLLTAGDFEGFVDKCLELKLLDNNHKIAFNTLFSNPEDQELMEALAIELNGTEVSSRGVAMVVMVSVALIIVVVLALTIAQAHETYSAPLPIEPSSNDTIAFSGHSFLHSNHPEFAVFDLLALKNKSAHSYQLIDAYQDRVARSIVDTLKTVKPEVFERYSETQIYELMKSNLLLNC